MAIDRFAFSDANCSIRRTLDVVGEKWTLLVLREAFYGTRRFDDFVALLDCSRAILSARLKRLVEEGLLRGEPYQEAGRRTRMQYRLTDKGRELFPALLALLQWGDRFAADARGPAVEIVHRRCGGPVAVDMRCSRHGKVTVADIDARPGPGAKRRSTR